MEALRAYEADLQVVVAFRLLPEIIWDMPRFGTFNVHAALLPQYRGAAPINWAVINGETETGVTTFFLDKDVDTGRIILQKPFPIPADADVEYVYDGLMNLGAGLALETIDLMLAHDGNIPSKDQQQIIDEAQLGDLKPAPKIFKETCEIQWQQTAKQLHDFIRGLSPVPGSWTTVSVDGKPTTTLKIYKAAPTARPATGALAPSFSKRATSMSTLPTSSSNSSRCNSRARSAWTPDPSSMACGPWSDRVVCVVFILPAE